MCGRYTLHTEKEALARRFALEASELDALGDWQPRYNIAPTQGVLAVALRGGRRRALLLRWGLVPYWTAPGAALPHWINARAETLARRPAFREAFARRRCLIPASGFYEWQAPRGASRRKTPHWIARRDGRPFAMAGLWERWHPPGGATLESCAIVTTAAGPCVREIHARMPVILRESAEHAWLSHELDGELPELEALLEPLPDDELVARPVSTAVNSALREGPELIERSDGPQLGFLDGG
jgi:putative SOS response-associated peptidase YedK